MLLFRSEEEVAAWCATAGEPRGETLTLPQVWMLSQAWYGDRMDAAYRGRTAEQAQAIFARCGLTGAFWQAERLYPQPVVPHPERPGR